MEAINLWCEAGNCGSAATVFGIKEKEKIRRCEAHMADLTGKKLKIFDISGYYFISTLQDAVLLEERETLVKKGRGNLTVLESNCHSELTAAIATIDREKGKVLRAVEARFEEMKAAVTEACKKTISQLSQLEANLEQFLISKENQLSPTAQLVCSALNSTPGLLRFRLADVSDGVIAVLRDCWTATTPDINSVLKGVGAGQKDAAIEREVAERAKKAGEERKRQEMSEVSARARVAETSQPQPQSWYCPFCNKPTKAGKCSNCRTIHWPTVMAASKKRSLSARPAEPTSITSTQRQRSSSMDPQHEHEEDRAQRDWQMIARQTPQNLIYCESCSAKIQFKGFCDECSRHGMYCKKCSVRYKPSEGCCPRCEKICRNCRRVFDAKMPFCPHCNKGRKNLCKQCGRAEAYGPSGLCSTCARPASSPQKSFAKGQTSRPRRT